MQTNIHPDLIALPKVQEADAILRKCVHCGFCTATCPTYQLLGDELDGEDLSWLEQATAAVA